MNNNCAFCNHLLTISDSSTPLKPRAYLHKKRQSIRTASPESPHISIFSPEIIRPHPKAGPRKETNRGKKKRSSAVWTDTPVKEALEAEKAIKDEKKKSVKRAVLGKITKEQKDKKKKISKPVNQTPDSSTDEDEENCFCLVCLEPYQGSRSKEVWIQCLECKGWSHEECTKGDRFYVCHNCESE